ncbi:S-layer homology domain-containing protein [Paenibacillus sp. Dod16]|uniref:S-layer homology domain-containing protein n=1 Tax=Paenibacillus sp. Dod16 TaxID=3416392 RepID=UPI003CF3E143
MSSEAWYANAVAYSKSNNLMSGTTETTFTPIAPMSRAMLATVLWRMDSSPLANDAMSFEDVAPGTWYTEAIRWANSAGIISGYNSQTFGTNDYVTREQIATLVFRYEKYKNGDIDITEQLDFADSNQVRDWATESVAWAKQNNIMNGKPGNRFDPQGQASRAEVAAVLMGYRSRLATREDFVYADGDYTATGQYGGLPSTITVSVTLNDDVITDVNVTTHATNPTSLDLQRRFAAAVPAVVVGKRIDEVNVGRLAGSSHTPDGFNDAIQQIKEQAGIGRTNSN